MFITLLITPICLVLLSLPGAMLYLRFVPDHEDDAETHLLLSMLFGLSWSVFLVFWAAHFEITWFYLLWGGSLMAGLPGFSLRYSTRKLLPPVARWFRKEGNWLPILLLGVFLAHGLSLLNWLVPAGFDPSFHLLLARKASELGHWFHDWQPYNPALLNYPLGFHFYLVILQQMTHRPLHELFLALYPINAVLNTWLVYWVGRHLFRSHAVGMWSGFAFAFLAMYGSVSYPLWGGVVNWMGVNLLLGSLVILAACKRKPFRILGVALSYCAIFAIHHHVLLTTTLVYGAIFLSFLCAPAKHRTRAWELLQAGFLALCIIGWKLIPYALRIRRLAATGVLRFYEPYFTPTRLLSSLGWGFSLFVVIGVVSYAGTVLGRRNMPTDKPSDNEIIHDDHWILFTIPVLIMVIMFFLGSYGYRWYMLWQTGKEAVAFTPSRFLTDAVPLLAPLAGLGFVKLESFAQRCIHSRFGVVTLLVSIGLLGNASEWRKLWTAKTISQDDYRAFQFIERHSPREAIVLTRHRWGPYLSGRRCMATPLPISEELRGEPRYRKEVTQFLKAGGPLAGQHFPVPLLVIAYPGELALPASLLWQDTSTQKGVYRLKGTGKRWHQNEREPPSEKKATPANN